MSSPLDFRYIERNTLKLMIQSTEFMTYISNPLHVIFDKYRRNELIKSKEIETIMRWVLDYFQKYQKAPLYDIESIVYKECDKIKRTEKERADLLEGLVQTICDEIENDDVEFNAKAQWDNTKEYFDIRRAELLSEDLKVAADTVDIDYIQESLNRFSQTECATSKLTSILENEDLVDRAHAQNTESLLRLPGALGEMLNRLMIPGGFVSFLGSEKRGKSWILMYLQMQAAANRIPTLMFQCGDMSEEDVAIRTGVYLTRRSNDPQYCGEIAIPVLDCAKCQSGECVGKGLVLPGQNSKRESNSRKNKNAENNDDIEWNLDYIKQVLKANKSYQPCIECKRNGNKDYRGAVYWKLRQPVEPITPFDQKEAYKKFIDRYKIPKSAFPIITEHPTFSLRVSEMDSILEGLKTVGRLPKIVFIDYIDLLRQENNDARQSTHLIWGAVRGLASKYKILIVTATQTNKEGYDTYVLGEGNFSEDKRKNSHVTAFLGLNQTPKEKEMGIMRINTILARGVKFNKKRTVSVLQCLEIGQPIMGSYWT